MLQYKHHLIQQDAASKGTAGSRFAFSAPAVSLPLPRTVVIASTCLSQDSLSLQWLGDCSLLAHLRGNSLAMIVIYLTSETRPRF